MDQEPGGRAMRSQSLRTPVAPVEGVFAPLSSMLLGVAATVIGAVGFMSGGYPAGGFTGVGAVAAVGPLGVAALGGDVCWGGGQATALTGPESAPAQPASIKPAKAQPKIFWN